jgi:hypothetical protein
LRAELATLVDDFSPPINELWPRLEDHKYRWELHSYGLPEGYDTLIVADITDHARHRADKSQSARWLGGASELTSPRRVPRADSRSGNFLVLRQYVARAAAEPHQQE